MTVLNKEVTANYVPAAAVKRRSQALSGITGCKGSAGGRSSWLKSMGSTHELLSKLIVLSSAEVGGIPGVAVECVDIGRNTSGEGGLLGTN